jgi:aminoglycoside phosphotransferase (APT) family kinase protein
VTGPHVPSDPAPPADPALPPTPALPPLPPLLVGTTLEAAMAAVEAEGRGLDLTGARLHDEGYENLVLRTADGWILRFPRREEPDFAREVALLARLDGRLAEAVPQVAWTGTHCRLMAYRALDGASFDAAEYGRADARRRNRLAASMARFLAVLHTALSAAEIAELGIPAFDAVAQMALVTGRLDLVPAQLRARAEDVVEHFGEAWVAEPRPVRQVLLHNDVHPLNMVFDGAGELTGVWDFSCVQVGPPSLDLRYLARVPSDAPPELRRDLMQRVADQYGRTGITLDVDGARAAMALEDLVEAIDAGDFRRFAADGVWGWPGADRG